MRRSTGLLLALLTMISACHRHRHPVSATVPPPPPPQPSTTPVRRTPAARRPATAATPPPPAAQAPSATTTPTSPAPVLVPSMTSAQREAALQDMQAALQRSQAVLARTANIALTPAQQGAVARIRSFMQQAQAGSGTDPAMARASALRADALAQDLAKSLP